MVVPRTLTLPLAAGDGLERLAGMLVTLRGPLTVVWDRHKIHNKSKAVKAFLAAHPEVVAEDLPAYCPQSTNGSGSHFDAYWLRISVRLPSTYGQGGLTPGGEPAAGWWKIRYTVAGGNDTTTWAVTIRGNPVHLIPD